MMMLVCGPNGGISWQNTSTFVRNNWDEFCKIFHKNNNQSWFDFGAGPELTFTCDNCNRTLPLAISEADHINAKSTLSVMLDQAATEITKANDTLYTFPPTGTTWTIRTDTAHAKITDFRIVNGMFYLGNGAGGHFMNGTSLLNVAKNDIHNIQLLCAYCNRSKGNK